MLSFWARGEQGGESLSVSLLDNVRDGVSTQSGVELSDWGDLSDEWTRFEIPLSSISSHGRQWNPLLRQHLFGGLIDWGRIQQVLFQIAPQESGELLRVYLDDVAFIESEDR